MMSRISRHPFGGVVDGGGDFGDFAGLAVFALFAAGLVADFALLVGVFGVVVAGMLGATDRPSRADLVTYTLTMLLLIVVGVLGSVLHIGDNLTSRGVLVVERFIRGAPFLAPLLFANMGTLGLIVLLDPVERTR